jgi:hypothetical protein
VLSGTFMEKGLHSRLIIFSLPLRGRRFRVVVWICRDHYMGQSSFSERVANGTAFSKNILDGLGSLDAFDPFSFFGLVFVVVFIDLLFLMIYP